MTARGGVTALVAVLLFGAAVALMATGSPWASIPAWAFWVAVVVALVVRVLRSRSPRDALRPAGQGLDEVQDLYLGRVRPPLEYSGTAGPVAELVEPLPDDRLAGGPVTLDPPPDVAR